MLSSRERRPATAGNSNRNQMLSGRSSGRPKSSCKKSHEQLNDPILVNPKYNCTLKPEPNRYPPTIPPNHERYPTITGTDNLVQRQKRPMTCPESFIHANLNPTWEENPEYLPRVGDKMRKQVSQNFIEHNYEYMSEYRPEYRDLTPRAIREKMMSDFAFCSTMRELKKKECSVRNGTSSFLLRSTLRHRGNDHNNRDSGTRFDPYVPSLHTSREQRVDKMNRLFMPSTEIMSHNKTFNRGYQHDKEFKNFSAFNGHLLRNKGSMLER